ncbi:Glycosyl hydrolases family 16 [compost metagenome]
MENGKLKINLKKETFKDKAFTGGGIITKQPRRYGYYETSVKIDGGHGWHEAFWTSWLSGFEDKNPAYKNMDKLEIDCFEHYAGYNNNYFTYGAIQWSPVKRNVNRDYHTAAKDLTAGYNVFGFEYTPDHLNYYFNGTLLKSVDIRIFPKHDLYLWLSCIATKPDATERGAVFFDYLRYYEIPEHK